MQEEVTEVFDDGDESFGWREETLSSERMREHTVSWRKTVDIM